MHKKTPKGHPEASKEILELIKEEGYAHFEATVISKGRVTIPIAIRKALNLKVGDRVELILKTSHGAPPVEAQPEPIPRDRGRKSGGRKTR